MKKSALALMLALASCSTQHPGEPPSETTVVQPSPEKTEKSREAITAGEMFSTGNGAFISFGYVSSGGGAFRANVMPYMLDKMRLEWGISELYVNVGLLNRLGTLVTVPTGSENFLTLLKQYEVATGYTFKVYAWLNGRSDYCYSIPWPDLKAQCFNSNSNLIHPEDPGWRTAFSTTAEKFVKYGQPTLTYGTDASPVEQRRKYDGIMVDFEPNGLSGACTGASLDRPMFHECTLNALNNLRLRLANASSCPTCSIGITAHQLRLPGESSPQWKWSAYQYNRAAQGLYADTIIGMLYDASGNYYPTSSYEEWMSWEVQQILLALDAVGVSGGVPAPPSRRFHAAFPAWQPYTSIHPAEENIRNAAQGTYAGLSQLESQLGITATARFSGAAFYAMNTGFHADGFGETPPCGPCGCVSPPYTYRDPVVDSNGNPVRRYATVAQDMCDWQVWWLGSL